MGRVTIVDTGRFTLRGLGLTPGAALDAARVDIGRRTEPQRSESLRRYLEPPEIIAPASVAMRLRTVRYGAVRDVPREVQLAAGAVEMANVLRVLYVEPVVDGAEATTAAHELKSVAFSTAREGLGTVIGSPQTLLSGSSTGTPVQLAGFASTQVREGIGGERPMMLAVARPLDGSPNEYILVDHDPASSTARALRITGVPRPGRFRAVTPGLSWGTPMGGGRLLGAFVSEAASGMPEIVVGRIVVAGDTASFVESDRAPVVPGPSGSRFVWFDVCVDYQPALSQWVVASTVDNSIWDGRFNVVDAMGRFYRPLRFASPAPTNWFPPSIESPHSGNGVRAHPVTGNVVFKAAHNTASGEVSAEQRWTNQWVGIVAGDDAYPPETFPGGTGAGLATSRGNRWSVAPCQRAPWEFITTSAGGYTAVVTARVGRSPPTVANLGRLFPSSGDSGNTGCHAITRVDALLATAHVGVWNVGGLGETELGVGFVEDQFRG
jgi:hypothetical protein